MIWHYSIRILAAIVLLSLFATISYAVGRPPEMFGSVGICLLLALTLGTVRMLAARRFSEDLPESLRWALLIPPLVAIVLCFRIAWFDQVPRGYSWEAYAFIHFAERQRSEGLHFIPYKHFYHTLWGYLLSVPLTLGYDTIEALRICGAIFAVVAIISVGWTSALYFGSLSGVLSASFAASSFWLVWASRSGWQKFLMIPGQALLLCGLAIALRGHPWRGALVGSLGVSWGAYSYWGFYLTPPVIGLLIACLYIANKSYRSWLLRWTLSVTAISLVAIAPLVWFFAHIGGNYLYPADKVLSQPSIHWSLQYWNNLKFYLWALSGNLDAHAFGGGGYSGFLPLTIAPITVCLIVGLILLPGKAIAGWSRFIPGMLFVAHLLLVPLTGAENQYAIALFLPVYCVAGFGAASLLNQTARILPNHTYGVHALVLLVMATVGFMDYREAFHSRRITHFEGDLSLHLKPYLEEIVISTPVYVPISDPSVNLVRQLANYHTEELSGFSVAEKLRDLPYSKLGIPTAQLAGHLPWQIVLPPRMLASHAFTSKLLDMYGSISGQYLFYDHPRREVEPQPIALAITVPPSARIPLLGPRVVGVDPRCGFILEGAVFAAEHGIGFAYQESPMQRTATGPQLSAETSTSTVELLLESGFNTITTCSTNLDNAPKVRIPGEQAPTEFHAATLKPELPRRVGLTKPPPRWSNSSVSVVTSVLEKPASDCRIEGKESRLLLHYDRLVRRWSDGSVETLHTYSRNNPMRSLSRLGTVPVVWTPHIGAEFVHPDGVRGPYRPYCYLDSIDCSDYWGCIGICQNGTLAHISSNGEIRYTRVARDGELSETIFVRTQGERLLIFDSRQHKLLEYDNVPRLIRERAVSGLTPEWRAATSIPSGEILIHGIGALPYLLDKNRSLLFDVTSRAMSNWSIDGKPLTTRAHHRMSAPHFEDGIACSVRDREMWDLRFQSNQ